MNECNNAHLRSTLGALKRVDLINALYACSPTASWELLLIVRAVEGLLCIRRGYLTGLEGQLIELIKPRIGCPTVIEDLLR